VTAQRYRGRFAPSPTGPLHFGSLAAAVGSFLEARSRGGEWLVRMEDLDPPREAPGAAADILRTLERLGLHWDGEVLYQSTRAGAYEDAIERLRAARAVYGCGCSRREIADSSLPGIEGPVYPGTCRAGIAGGRVERALRVRTDNAVIEFEDRWQGRLACALERDIGDFVVQRADGFIAYQLAVVVDDAAQGITDVVRGADLLYSTPRQLHLQRLLGLSPPRYAHLPAAVNAAGEKLSKQTGAAAVSSEAVLPLLRRVLGFLGQDAPNEIERGELASFWRFAVAHWDGTRVPRARAVPVPY
jgi:glutamyl-Q tRNA(Asp) synthetase